MINILLITSLISVFSIISIKYYLKNYVQIKKHKYSSLSFNEKKNIIINNFNSIKSRKIRLSKQHNNIYKQKPRDIIGKNLDLNFLSEVVNIDLENKTIHVEGLITYEKLLDYTLQYRLIPQIVPEFKALTVGGTISGVGLESSSFKYGLVPDMVYEFEILTGTGDILTVNKDTNKDLYLGFPNTYGTLGYILSAKLKLVDAKPYVHVKNILFNDPNKYIEEINKYSNDNPDNINFLDGMILNKNELYLMKGEMIEEKPPFMNQYICQIYYKTINQQKEDYMMIKDYIWRYDSNSFYLNGGIIENRFLRYYFKDLLSGYKLKRISELPIFSLFPKNKNIEKITNDLAIKLKNFTNFLDWYDEYINVYPTWICPYECKKNYSFFKCDNKLELDFGIGFGVRKIKEDNNGINNYYKRLIDDKMYSMKSIKGLYSDTFLTEEKFWELYDPENKYEFLKKKYDPNDRFLNLYEKAVKNK
jgi:hypothetical protein